MTSFHTNQSVIIWKKIIQYRHGACIETVDEIVTEFHFQLQLQCQFLASFTCTPTHIDELITGYLISSSIVNSENKLIHIEYNTEKHIADITLENNDIALSDEFRLIRPQGCSGGKQTMRTIPANKYFNDKIIINPIQVNNFIRHLQQHSETHQRTGGNHSAALATSEQIKFFREDIGRHNAVDKVIGAAYLNKLNLNECILITSGRVSSEIALKAVHASIPVIISRSAPTDQAVQIAEHCNITLIGFARNNNFNIYSGAHRVQI